MKNTKTYSSALAVERSGEAERSEAGPTAVGVDCPNPEVVARAKRRIFTGEYKQRVLLEADKVDIDGWRLGLAQTRPCDRSQNECDDLPFHFRPLAASGAAEDE